MPVILVSEAIAQAPNMAAMFVVDQLIPVLLAGVSIIALLSVGRRKYMRHVTHAKDHEQ